MLKLWSGIEIFEIYKQRRQMCSWSGCDKAWSNNIFTSLPGKEVHDWTGRLRNFRESPRDTRPTKERILCIDCWRELLPGQRRQTSDEKECLIEKKEWIRMCENFVGMATTVWIVTFLCQGKPSYSKSIRSDTSKYKLGTNPQTNMKG